MIKYEFKKLPLKLLYIILSVSAIFLVGVTIYFMRSAAEGVRYNARYYEEKIEYSEELYDRLLYDRNDYYARMSEATDETEKEEYQNKFKETNAKISMFNEINTRIYNLKVFKTYKNWNDSLQYSYDLDEKYSIVDTSMWNWYFKFSKYEVISLILVIIIALLIHTSDNREGNRKVAYVTFRGKYSIISIKRLITYVGAVAITIVSMLIELVVNICMGLDMGLLDIGLYQLSDFPFAPSYMSIGEYALYTLIGYILFNLLIVAVIDLLTSFMDKKVFVSVLTALFIVVLGIFKEDMWLNPITMLETSYYFNNVREYDFGSFVAHQYYVTSVFMVLLILAFGLIVRIIQNNQIETE